MTNPRSTAKIAGHPIHPMLIPFPIVFFVSTFVTDLVFLSTGAPGWATASMWLLGVWLTLSGIVVALLLFNGWQGWELVYRHRVGIADDIGP